jgi:hypothetical protein
MKIFKYIIFTLIFLLVVSMAHDLYYQIKGL